MSNIIKLNFNQLNSQGGIYCPNLLNNKELWNQHPKVYINISKTGEGKCPYCGTIYKLKDGEKFKNIH